MGAAKMWMLCALATALATPQLAAGAKRKRTAATRPPLTRGDVRAVDTSVLERGLTEEGELSTTRVLAEHGHYHADVNSRNFNGTVLGYVTPWWVAGRQHGAFPCFAHMEAPIAAHWSHEVLHMGPCVFKWQERAGVRDSQAIPRQALARSACVVPAARRCARAGDHRAAGRRLGVDPRHAGRLS